MENLFRCPTCTADLDYDGGNHLTVKCDYCSSTVIVPESLRPQVYTQDFAPLLAKEKALQSIMELINKGELVDAGRLYFETYNVSRTEASDSVQRLAEGMTLDTSKIQAEFEYEPLPESERSSGCGCTLPIFILLIALGVTYYIDSSIFTRVSTMLTGVYAEATGENPPDFLSEIDTIIAESGLGVTTPIIYTIGERGINPSQFNNPRGLAVGGDGAIFVADSGNERVQQFRTDGTFKSLIIHPDGESFNPLDIAYGPGFILYSMNGRQIERFDARAGTYIDELIVPVEDGGIYTHLHVTDDGDLLILRRRDALIRLDLETNEAQTISLDAIPDWRSFDAVTTDADGNYYIAGEVEDELDDLQDRVFKLSPDGVLLAEIGDSGFVPGRFSGFFGGIAVDENGYLFVSDFQGVQVFDPNGNFETLIQVEGFAVDIEFDQAGNLLVISNQHLLYKFDVSQIGRTTE